MDKENEIENYKPQFSKLLQIGIIVRDIDACIQKYEKDYGFGPWKVDIMSNENPVFKRLTINGEKSDFKIKLAICNCFGLQFELIEPISDSPYKTWLENHGPGLHNLSFVTKDSYEEVIDNHKKNSGKDPWVRGICKSIGMDFSYLDLTDELGFIAGIYGSSEKNKVTGHDF